MISPYFYNMVKLMIKQMGLPEFKPVTHEDYKALAIIGAIEVGLDEKGKDEFGVFKNFLLPTVSDLIRNEDTIEKIIEILKEGE